MNRTMVETFAEHIDNAALANFIGEPGEEIFDVRCLWRRGNQ